jgi:post-segregation antitoxin (ccd killing protein)
MRLNVSVPDDLVARVRTDLPDLNVSAVLQTALRRLLDCDHENLACADCGEPVDGSAAAGEELSLFWSELVHAWGPLVDKGGTAEGAARVAKGVAVGLGVPNADRVPLPRPVRSKQRWAS